MINSINIATHPSNLVLKERPLSLSLVSLRFEDMQNIITWNVDFLRVFIGKITIPFRKSIENDQRDNDSFKRLKLNLEFSTFFPILQNKAKRSLRRYFHLVSNTYSDPTKNVIKIEVFDFLEES